MTRSESDSKANLSTRPLSATDLALMASAVYAGMGPHSGTSPGIKARFAVNVAFEIYEEALSRIEREAGDEYANPR